MKVSNTEETVVQVTTGTSVEYFTGTILTGEWVVNHSVPSLESDLGLEGVLTNRTYHLEWDVGTVEHTSVVWTRTLITDTNEVSTSSGGVRINVDSHLTIKNTCEGVASVINIELSVEGW